MTIKEITNLFKRYITAKYFCQKVELKYGSNLENKPSEIKKQIDYNLVSDQYKLFKKNIKTTDEIIAYMEENFDHQTVLCVKRHYMNDESTASLAEELNVSKRKLDYDIRNCLKKVQEHFNDK